jgi:hypothetical protein
MVIRAVILIVFAILALTVVARAADVWRWGFGGLMVCSSPVSYANCNGLDGGDTSCPTLGASSLCFSLSELNDVTNPVADYANLPVYYAVGATGGTGGYSGGDGTLKITVFWSTVPTQ